MMPAAPQTASPPPPAPRGVRWLTAEEAAGRMKVSGRRIKQLCAGTWRAKGLAVQREPIGGGRIAWHVREDADAALARVQFGESIPFDWNQYTDPQREQIKSRLVILRGWTAHMQSAFAQGKSKQDATGDYLRVLEETRAVRMTWRTLYNLQTRFRRHGHAGLVDGRWDKAAADRAADPFLDEFKRLFLDQRQRSYGLCHRLTCQLAAERGWAARSYDACRRYMKSLPPGLGTLKRKGESAYEAECEPFIQRDYSTLASNEIWCGDHHQFDVLVNAGGPKLVRPWLTAWQDMRSRKIVGWLIFDGNPNTETILAAFRAGVLDCGVPGTLYVDNGKDYDSYALNGRTKKDRWQKRRVRVALDAGRTDGVFAAMNVKVQHCWTYHGQSKPIERFFGTLESSFSRVYPTYCGKSPADRPEDLQLQIERGKAPRLADFIADFSNWLSAAYHGQPHRGDSMDGKTPDLVFAENLHTKRTAEPALLETLLLPRSKPVKVTRNGVRFKGLLYGANEPALYQWAGKDVVLATDDRDVSRLQVYSPEGKFICVAQGNRRLPANANGEVLRAAILAKKQHRKTVQAYHESRPRLHEDLPDLMYRAAVAQRDAQASDYPQPAPPNIQPIRSELEDQLPAIARAMKREPLRKAVGAEALTFEDLGALLTPRAESICPADRLVEVMERDEAERQAAGHSVREIMLRRAEESFAELAAEREAEGAACAPFQWPRAAQPAGPGDEP